MCSSTCDKTSPRERGDSSDGAIEVAEIAGAWSGSSWLTDFSAASAGGLVCEGIAESADADASGLAAACRHFYEAVFTSSKVSFKALAEDKASRISVTCGCMGGISKSFASETPNKWVR